MTNDKAWRRCSACKQPIALGATYWTCNVSTCNRKRTALAFCTVSCWEVHLPGANHRESWAVEKTAPMTPDATETAFRATPAKTGNRRLVRPEATNPAAREEADEILIVGSRLKQYIRAKSGGFNTSDGVLGPLSDLVRHLCDEAIQNARRDGRMTVMERDVPKG